VVALWCATQGLTKYRSALTENRAEQQAAEEKLAATRTAIARGELAQKKIHEWLKQSLPTDADIAQSLYHDWLRRQLSAAGLRVKQLSNKQSTLAQSKYYKQHTFTIEAEGKLANLVTFLHRFYQAGHLHRISKAALTPTNERQELALFLIVDALALGDSTRSDRLTEEASSTQPLPEEQLQQKIASRNLFALYQPSRQPSPATSQAIAQAQPDTEAAQARVSSIIKSVAGWRMSIFNSQSGKVLFFREGDAIEIGKFKGTIDKLDARRVIISTADNRVQLRLGQYLNQAQPVTESDG
ncbi:MAG: hypothetical protein MI865_04355, partial [Proteobacteria bacterium]|nr:hypothetical protein [Pseudomonadota bacterium]